jgi:hypothetical protein
MFQATRDAQQFDGESLMRGDASSMAPTATGGSDRLQALIRSTNSPLFRTVEHRDHYLGFDNGQRHSRRLRQFGNTLTVNDFMFA